MYLRYVNNKGACAPVWLLALLGINLFDEVGRRYTALHRGGRRLALIVRCGKVVSGAGAVTGCVGVLGFIAHWMGVLV